MKLLESLVFGIQQFFNIREIMKFFFGSFLVKTQNTRQEMVPTSWNKSSASTKIKMRLFFYFVSKIMLEGHICVAFPNFLRKLYFFSRKIGARFTFLMISAKLLRQVRRTYFRFVE